MSADHRFQPLNLCSPPAAQTESSIALVWDRPEGSAEIESYNIHQGGRLIGNCRRADFTVDDLPAQCRFNFQVWPVLKNGRIAQASREISMETSAKSRLLNIVDYGAVGDGRTLNTQAIQSAIDSCSFGDTVVVPEGVFLTGAIFLKSGLTLHVAKGGTLLGSSDPDDYPVITLKMNEYTRRQHASLINGGTRDGEALDHVKITGQGKIDGSGNVLLHREEQAGRAPRGRLILLRNCRNVYLKDITLRNSPAWCLHLTYCDQVSMNNIKVYTKTDENGQDYHLHNGDGIDPDSCRDVFIFNSLVASQDDCIAIKSGRDEEGRRIGRPSENIRITDCVFKSGLGVAVGSEISGGIRNVLVRNCTFENVYSLASIKAPRGRGSVAENIRFEDITLVNHDTELADCRWFRGAIYVDHYYSHETFDPTAEEPFGETTPVFRNILFKNITLDTAVSSAIYVVGLPESPVRNISFENISAVGRKGLIAENIDGLLLKNVSVTAHEGEDYTYRNVRNLVSY